MERKKYYVSVQSGAILEDQTADSYEFEIYASNKELTELEELFNFREDAENATFIRSFIPALAYHNDQENDDYDAVLSGIYKKIHELGTEVTRRQIERMRVL
ncbi:hypothetical protein [Chengkuizengella axinellae]|uniref:Hydrolase n=1 Tax=Chengkuizengella axinellae TaxID=3064388 RepID=A0ABT9IZ98_9BACL|nr:hypothetical protein [Chengkuizengella sp. 2205SS18-9]MDP5274696.1 hypothetical protein [Chengkuizengella sp. 2205SS18-9]